MEQKDGNKSGVIENGYFSYRIQAIVKRSLEILENKVKNKKDKNAKT